MKSLITFACAALALVLLAGCATTLPRPGSNAEPPPFADGLDGPSVFADSVAAHGGDLRESVEEIRMAVTGEWGGLIKRIQPLVTDYKFRIESEERLLPDSSFYAVRWTGPDGEKSVERGPDSVRVHYNGVESVDEDILASSAMTSDAFQLFHFGPSFLLRNGATPTRLPDYREKGRDYYQLHFRLRPGFGRASEDEVVLLIDKTTRLAYRVWITLEGFRTTQGASVDVTFLEYEKVEGLTLPTRFVERVRAPISIHAHRWHVLSRTVVRK